MKIKCIRLLPLILLVCILVSPYAHAQKKGKTITIDSIYFFKPLPDSIWTGMPVREKLEYSMKFAENPMQLCGLWPVDSGRNEQAFIYLNTRQLFFLGEYYYSKRQRDFFDQHQDSVAWLLREDLFENKKNLYYWHNIIRYMKPNKPVGLALMDYYRSLEKKNSIPLTLLMGWMEYDSFPAYLSSPLRQQIDKSKDGKISHSQENTGKLIAVIKSYLSFLSVQRRTSMGHFSWIIYDSLTKADTTLQQTGYLSDAVFRHLNAKELYAYCLRRPEAFYDTVMTPETSDDFAKIFPVSRKGRIKNEGLSSRQRDRLKLLNRITNISALCQFMQMNQYPPFKEFWLKNSKEGKYIDRTPLNEQIILRLAVNFYEWKMMTDGEE